MGREINNLSKKNLEIVTSDGFTLFQDYNTSLWIESFTYTATSLTHKSSATIMRRND